MSLARRFVSFARLASLGLALAVFAVPGAHAAAAQAPKKELGAAVAEALAELRALTENKRHEPALELVEHLSASAAPGSFDAYVLGQIKAQIFLTKGDYAAALDALEFCFRLGEATPVFTDAASRREQLYLLAQLHAQLAPEKKEPAAVRAALETALDHIRRWRRETTRPTADARIFAASVLFQLATLDSTKPDAARLREAIAEIREGLLSTPTPSEQALTLLAAAHLQLEENLLAAEWLELLVERQPKSASAWSQLLAIYLGAAGEGERESEARRLNLRALSVIERAQQHGFLVHPNDRYTQVALLFNLRQFGLAAERIEKGLASGEMENTRRNWELLSSAYLQLGQEARALEVLARAVERFPGDGSLEFNLAQSLYQQGRLAEAYARAESAVSKPGLEKPGHAKTYLAFLAFELQRYADADRWIAAARAGGDALPDSLEALARAVAEALRGRQS